MTSPISYLFSRRFELTDKLKNERFCLVFHDIPDRVEPYLFNTNLSNISCHWTEGKQVKIFLYAPSLSNRWKGDDPREIYIYSGGTPKYICII
jgi:hypothetical protein